MKKVFLFLAIAGSLVACNSSEENTITSDTTTTIVTPAPMTGDTMNMMGTDTTTVDTLPQ